MLLGAVLGRWWFLAVALASWIALGTFLVINDGWYGNGLGEGGEAWIVTGAALTLLSTSVGVALGRAVRRLRWPPGSRPAHRGRV
jgi:hypothetical protein